MLASAVSSEECWKSYRVYGSNSTTLLHITRDSTSASSRSELPPVSKPVDSPPEPENSATKGHLESAKQEITNLAKIGQQENWDGEGASKISTETIEIALKLLEEFPIYVLGEDLDIDATPFGSIDFGWVLERGVMMNVMVLPSKEIAFAYSVHGERDDGKRRWNGTLPPDISEVLDRVFHHERSDG